MHRILCTTLRRQMLAGNMPQASIFIEVLSKCSKCLVLRGHFEFGESGDQPFGWTLDVDPLKEIAPHGQKHA